MRYLLLIGFVVLAGCTNTGAQSIGKDTFMISTRVPFGGPASASGEAIQSANVHCGLLRKRMLLDNINSYECALHGGCGEAQVTFFCLNSDDPQYIAGRK
jgi:hypothetical protein